MTMWSDFFELELFKTTRVKQLLNQVASKWDNRGLPISHLTQAAAPSELSSRWFGWVHIASRCCQMMGM